MNQTSISAADTGSSGILLKQGVSDTKESADSPESGSFLSALGAIFKSDGESPENTEASADKVSEAELSAEFVEELVQSDGEEASESEEVEAGKATNEVTASGKDSAATEDESEVVVKSGTTEEAKVAKAMSEGNELLVRLDESSQALSKADGKSLPPTEDEKRGDAGQSEKLAALEPFIEKSGIKEQEFKESEVTETGQHSSEVVLNEGGEVEVSDLQKVASGKISAETETLSDETGKARLANHEEAATGQLSASKSKEQQAAVSDQLAPAGMNSEAMGRSIPDSSEKHMNLEQNSSVNSEPLVWKSDESLPADITTTTDELVGHQPSIMAEHPEQIILASDVKGQGEQAPDSRELQALMQQLNLNDVPLEELSQDELEYLAQISAAGAQRSTVEGQVQMLKTSPEPGVAKQAIAASAAHNLAAQSALQTPPLQADRILQAAVSQQAPAELSLSQMSQAQAFNPSQAAVVSNAGNQQQMMKAAMALTGSAANAAGSDKADSKEAALSQQLAGLAASQGVQQSQARAEVQQAISQSPLQLSREAAGERLSEQVQMMMSKNLKNVDIRLDPPELGRMQIRMTMHNEGASVQFTVANHQARDVVEQALPRLREMLAQQGVQLSDSSVHQQSSGQRQNQYASGNENSGNGSQKQQGGELNLDESINLDVNIQSKDDGISYYA